MQVLTDGLVIKALNDFVEKASDEKPLGDVCGNAAGAQVEEFLLIDLT